MAVDSKLSLINFAVPLLLVSTSGAFSAAVTDDCVQIRTGNTRLLHLADDGPFETTYLSDHAGIISAGWRLGVLHRKCKSATKRGCGELLPPHRPARITT
ncbi:hypothetical protein T492DRAFT_880504 [Pavlovales sp. CCMP2436]|nr:hypothetical protein T492DRAFT_880504 [Pavlovales sp. CCMP2436]